MTRLFMWLRQMVRRAWDLYTGAQYVYLATDATNHVFRLRGRMSNKQSSAGFARQMARHGLQVRVYGAYHGEQIKET